MRRAIDARTPLGRVLARIHQEGKGRGGGDTRGGRHT